MSGPPATRPAVLVRADRHALEAVGGRAGRAWAVGRPAVLAATRAPELLARLHRALPVGALVEVWLLDAAPSTPAGPGRAWSGERLGAVVGGAGFEHHGPVDGVVLGRKALCVPALRARTLPDRVAPRLRMLVCGLNPSLYAADVGIGFARPGNRFWPAALAAGVAGRDRDPGRLLEVDRVGMTDLVKRATVGADELRPEEYRAGADRLDGLVRWLRPGVVCFVGLAGWRAAIDHRALAGPQPGGFAGRPAYLMPNTSGLNAHASLAQLTEHLRAAARLAGGRP